jgi:hypothetical protein
MGLECHGAGARAEDLVVEDGQDGAVLVLEILVAMEEQQHAKLLSLAREAVPGMTADDLKNPDDWRALHHDPRFNYEDGVLAGIRAAAAAVRRLAASERGGSAP